MPLSTKWNNSTAASNKEPSFDRITVSSLCRSHAKVSSGSKERGKAAKHLGTTSTTARRVTKELHFNEEAVNSNSSRLNSSIFRHPRNESTKHSISSPINKNREFKTGASFSKEKSTIARKSKLQRRSNDCAINKSAFVKTQKSRTVCRGADSNDEADLDDTPPPTNNLELSRSSGDKSAETPGDLNALGTFFKSNKKALNPSWGSEGDEDLQSLQNTRSSDNDSDDISGSNGPRFCRNKGLGENHQCFETEKAHTARSYFDGAAEGNSQNDTEFNPHSKEKPVLLYSRSCVEESGHSRRKAAVVSNDGSVDSVSENSLRSKILEILHSSQNQMTARKLTDRQEALIGSSCDENDFGTNDDDEREEGLEDKSRSDSFSLYSKENFDTIPSRSSSKKPSSNRPFSCAIRSKRKDEKVATGQSSNLARNACVWGPNKGSQLIRPPTIVENVSLPNSSARNSTPVHPISRPSLSGGGSLRGIATGSVTCCSTTASNSARSTESTSFSKTIKGQHTDADSRGTALDQTFSSSMGIETTESTSDRCETSSAASSNMKFRHSLCGISQSSISEDFGSNLRKYSSLVGRSLPPFTTSGSKCGSLGFTDSSTHSISGENQISQNGSNHSSMAASHTPLEPFNVVEAKNEQQGRLVRITQRDVSSGHGVPGIQTRIEVIDTSLLQQPAIFSVRHTESNLWGRQMKVHKNILLACRLAGIDKPPIDIPADSKKMFEQIDNAQHMHAYMERIVPHLKTEHIAPGLILYWWRAVGNGLSIIQNNVTGKMILLRNFDKTVPAAVDCIVRMVNSAKYWSASFLEVDPRYPTKEVVEQELEGNVNDVVDISDLEELITRDWGAADRISPWLTELVVQTPVGVRKSQLAYVRYSVGTDYRDPRTLLVQVHLNEPLSRGMKAYPVCMIPMKMESLRKVDVRLCYLQSCWFLRKLYEFHRDFESSASVSSTPSGNASTQDPPCVPSGINLEKSYASRLTNSGEQNSRFNDNAQYSLFNSAASNDNVSIPSGSRLDPSYSDHSMSNTTEEPRPMPRNRTPTNFFGGTTKRFAASSGVSTRSASGSNKDSSGFSLGYSARSSVGSGNATNSSKLSQTSPRVRNPLRGSTFRKNHEESN